jgi:hypothetical protein
VTRALEPFSQFPDRFLYAEMRGELTERQAKLCRFIVLKSFQGKASYPWRRSLRVCAGNGATTHSCAT